MRTALILSCVLLFSTAISNLQANEPTLTENLPLSSTPLQTSSTGDNLPTTLLETTPIEEVIPTNLPEPTNWTTTKTDPEAYATVTESIVNPLLGEKLIEIVNEGSISTTRTFEPQHSGRLTFSVKHDKSGLLYIFAQTSDNGGQLLFSLQFTESQGILLEESDRQITLLPEYTANQWYEFVIDFDNSRGDHGLFVVSIDGTLYGEYEYVKSESALFDLAQITIGGESSGQTSVSTVTDSFFTQSEILTTTPVSDALLQLSISLSSTSISSDLDNELIVTATFDGIAEIATSSASDIGSIPSSASEASSPNEPSIVSSVSSFFREVIESVIDIFITEDDSLPTAPSPTQDPSTTTVNTEPAQTESINPESIQVSPDTIETIPAETTPGLPPADPLPDQPVSGDAVQSSITTNEELNNEVTTTTF